VTILIDIFREQYLLDTYGGILFLVCKNHTGLNKKHCYILVPEFFI